MSEERRTSMSLATILLIAGTALLAAGIASLLAGKTIGLYGMIETRASIFYWIILATYLTLGAFSLYGAILVLMR